MRIVSVSACVVLLGMAGGAYAQSATGTAPLPPTAAPLPPTAAPQPAPGAAAPDSDLNKRRGEAIDEWGSVMKQLETQLQASTQLLHEKNLDFDQADRNIDEMMDTARRAIDLGGPDSPLIKEARKALSDAETFANEAKTRGRDAEEKEARDIATSMDSLISGFDKDHADFIDMLTRLHEQKARLARIKQIHSAAQARDILQQAHDDYQKGLDKTKALIEQMKDLKGPAS